MTAIEHEISAIDNVDNHIHLGIPGALMLAIMGVLWRAERPLGVTIIHQRVCEHHKPVAITTVSSTLTRLLHRGWVSKPRQKVYQAAITRSNLTADVTDRLARLIDDVVLAIEEV